MTRLVQGDPVYSGSIIVVLGHRISRMQRFDLADVDVQTPEPPRRISLRLDVYSPPQVLQIDGRLCHLVLAFLIEGDITDSRVPLLHGRCPTSSLLRTHPPPSRLRSTSRFSRLYDLPCSSDFAPGRERLHQLLSVSLSPCCRLHPAEVECRIGQISASHVAFALRRLARPSDLVVSRPHLRLLSLRPGDS